MIDGSDRGLKVKIYKHQGSAFISCHEMEDNLEYIYNLQEGSIQDGIFRIRWDNGKSAIGSKYFSRLGREEDREYRLIRSNKSGEIQYNDKIWGKDDSDWRWVAAYNFNRETFVWTKLNAE